jgi:hypothetical protein
MKERVGDNCLLDGSRSGDSDFRFRVLSVGFTWPAKLEGVSGFGFRVYLADEARGSDCVLDSLGRNILSLSELEDVLLAVHDAETVGLGFRV